MFNVSKKKEAHWEDKTVYTVYAVKEEDGEIQFLFYEYPGWTWRNADEYVPIK